MKKIDKLIQLKLTQNAKNFKLEPAAGCPSDLELSGYVSLDISQTKREVIENHLSECFLCLDKIVSAYDGEKLLAKRKLKTPSKHLIWKAKNIDRIIDNFTLLPRTQKLLTTEKAVIKWLPKNFKKNKWLIASITAFALSFAFPPVFLQFLLAAGILGGKWIFDSENAKTLIMIYNAWKKGDEKEVKDMLETLKNRIPSRK